ncbi:MAG: 2-amino-4-hydroxy-6-hydroxymethyldihydropteridine diphosphokinase [Burkholderiaceae bacterium]|nr:2-amino-4-hydroxy-6-hydroxymethyldihydropteridine diphosphokinase [Burkholderiaceae bacterium]
MKRAAPGAGTPAARAVAPARPHASRTGVRAFVGLGANLGQASDAIRRAIDALGAIGDTRVTAVSSLYRSAPIEATGPDFVNAVAELRTGLDPQSLLDALQTIEQAHGRIRGERNAPRTLDLDLLLHGDQVLDSDALSLPHPRMSTRAFVLRPLAEIDPGVRIPGAAPLDVLLARCAGQRVERIDDATR